MQRKNPTPFDRPAIIALAAAIGILLPSIVFAAGFATPGIGIKARSMGGAFRGLADDWSAASYNPAGLARLGSSELNFTLGTYHPRLTYTPDVSGNGLDIGFDAANGDERYPINDLWPIPSMSAIVVNPEWGGFVYGAVLSWPYDVNYAWDLFRAPSGYNTDYEFSGQSNRTDLDVLDFRPVAARKFGQNLSIGVGLSMTSADLVYRRVLFIENALGKPYDVYPYNQFFGDFRLEGNGFALGANAGIFWQASENFSIGISGQLPTTVTVKGMAELDMAWPMNSALDDGSVELNGDSVNTALYYAGVNDPLVQQHNRPHSNADFGFDLDLPAQIGIGFGWTPSERLTLAMDAAMTFWSAVDAWDITLEGGGLNAGTSPLTSLNVPFGWDDQVRISGGFEYIAKETLRLRGGAYYDGGAAPDSTFNINFPNDGNAIGLTGGFAYMVNANVEIAAAQELAFYSKRTVPSEDGANAQTVFPGEYSYTRYEFIVSIGYRF